MLTEEQARGLNLEQHALEAAELRQADAQKKMDRYYDAIKKATDAMKNGTPEQREKIAWILPKLVQWYKDAERERSWAENDYWIRVNKINEYKALDTSEQPTATNAGQRRRTVVPTPEVKETIITPEVVVPEQTPTPEVVNNVAPIKQNYYDVYAQMKWTWTPSADIANWFRWGLGTANSHNAYLVRQDLAKRWLTNQQINDFVQDWWNATLAPISVQYRLDSPQKIKTWGNENTPGLRTRGNWTGTLI